MILIAMKTRFALLTTMHMESYVDIANFIVLYQLLRLVLNKAQKRQN